MNRGESIHKLHKLEIRQTYNYQNAYLFISIFYSKIDTNEALFVSSTADEFKLDSPKIG